MWNNNVDIVGNLGSDPEVKRTQNGTAYASFSVAVNRKNGDTEYTDWIPVKAWGDLAEAAGSFLGKGMRVKIVGRYTASSFVGSNGQKVYITCVTAEGIFIQLFKDGVGMHAVESRTEQQAQPSQDRGNFQRFGDPVQPEHAYVNDDIPF